MRITPWKKRSEPSSDVGSRTWPMGRLRNEMDRLFNRFFGLPWWGEESSYPSSVVSGDWVPDIDIAEGDREIIVRAEIAGLEPKDIDISMTNNVLSISGEKKEDTEEKKDSYTCTECRYGAFRRTLLLPESADPNQVTADYDKGVLSIRIGKKEGAAARRIEIGSTKKAPEREEEGKDDGGRIVDKEAADGCGQS